MKKIGKKILIISLIALLTGVSSVKAATFKEGDKYDIKHTGNFDDPGLNVGGSAFDLRMYTVGEYVAYCTDPQNGAGKNYTVLREIGATSNGNRVQNMDAGLLTIIQKGYNQYNSSASVHVESLNTDIDLSGDDLYAATSIAVRAYTMGLFPFATKDATFGSGTNVASACTNLGTHWASLYIDNANTATENKCNGKACYVDKVSNNYSWFDEKKTFNYENDQNSKSYKIIYMAQQLFKAGVEAAAKRATGDLVKTAVSLEFNKKAESISKSETQEEKYIYATLKIENLPKKLEDGTDGKVELSVPTCTGCNVVSFEAQTDGEYKAIGAGNNIAELLKTDDENQTVLTGEIKLRIKVTQPMPKEDECEPATIKIDYKFNTNPQLTGAVLSDKNTTNTQRFFILDKQEGDQKGSASAKIGCPINACETSISLPQCTTNEADAIAVIKTDDNIKKCIIDNQDDAENEYLLIEANNGVSNDYCKVYCKENYDEIKLNPIVENVKCGGYFKLKSKINGTKTCYTGGDTDDSAKYGNAKSIDKEKYLKDIHDNMEQMIKYTNQYNYNSALLKVIFKTETFKSGCTNCEGKTSYLEGKKIKSTNNVEYKEYVWEWSDDEEQAVDFDYNTKKTEDMSFDDTITCEGAQTCKNGKTMSPTPNLLTPTASERLEEARKDWQTKVDEAKTKLTSLRKEYIRITADYNACTTGWTNNFAFEQKISYYYDENQGEEQNYTPYYDLVKGNTDLEKDGEESSKTVIKICKGSTDNEYTCLSGAVGDKDESVESDSPDQFNYKSSYGSDVFYNKRYVRCENDGECKDETRQISQSLFVKKEVNKEQSYITPSVFYQIEANGKVTTVELPDVLTNSLPTSTKSVGGGNFRLMIKGLGEFYDKNDNGKTRVGRLIDFGGDNENSSVAKALGLNGKEVFDGNYECQYKNLCRPKDCPNCEIDCKNGSCTWKECPTCDFTCINCIFNLGQLNMNVNTISSTNFNAAGRQRGYNWITSSTLEALQLLTLKASETIAEIEEVNEQIYDDKTTDGSRLAFSVKLTPDMIKTITKYNNDNLNKGGYLNSSLSCYDATTSDGKTYKNIYCYSELIDTLVDDYSDNVTVLPTRIREEGRRASETDNSGYWKLWDGYVYSESVIGGPSWK